MDNWRTNHGRIQSSKNSGDGLWPAGLRRKPLWGPVAKPLAGLGADDGDIEVFNYLFFLYEMHILQYFVVVGIQGDSTSTIQTCWAGPTIFVPKWGTFAWLSPCPKCAKYTHSPCVLLLGYSTGAHRETVVAARPSM